MPFSMEMLSDSNLIQSVEALEPKVRPALVLWTENSAFELASDKTELSRDPQILRVISE